MSESLTQKILAAAADRDELQIAMDYADCASPTLFDGLDWHMLLRSGHLGGQRSEHTRLAPLLECLADVASASEAERVQEYGLDNNWAGNWAKCPCGKHWAWGGNWNAYTFDGPCPRCRRNDALARLHAVMGGRSFDQLTDIEKQERANPRGKG